MLLLFFLFFMYWFIQQAMGTTHIWTVTKLQLADYRNHCDQQNNYFM